MICPPYISKKKRIKKIIQVPPASAHEWNTFALAFIIRIHISYFSSFNTGIEICKFNLAKIAIFDWIFYERIILNYYLLKIRDSVCLENGAATGRKVCFGLVNVCPFLRMQNLSLEKKNKLITSYSDEGLNLPSVPTWTWLTSSKRRYYLAISNNVNGILFLPRKIRKKNELKSIILQVEIFLHWYMQWAENVAVSYTGTRYRWNCDAT